MIVLYYEQKLKEGRRRMIELGKIQKLQVLRNTQVGVYLNTADNRDSEDILLPKKQVPEDIKIGDMIEVFVYRDSEDRMIATTKRPKLAVGEIGFLKVAEKTKIGAFLNWGLEKDLFLPFKEQTSRLQKGEECFVGLYIDKSNRICATMKIQKLLNSESPYKENDRVNGTIYYVRQDMGAFVAVDGKYEGLIPQNELYGIYEPGDNVEVRVTKVREDGKLYLSLRKKNYKEISKDAEIILEKMKANGGMLPLNDESSPNEINAKLSMSKGAFKKAVGRLLKEGKIKFTANGIKIV